MESSNAMRVTLLLLPILVTANPFHKYPYVFLLDIGNEELEKVNTEQIRLSSPGGSVALRYPAIGNGDDIAHVRVSGIDFGTDLKANIVNGGPGYKYVVIVLIGNQGVAFDAVITVQTVPADAQNIEQNSINKINTDKKIQVIENDPNDSAEDLKDPEESVPSSSGEKGELTQESVDVYNYAVNEALSGYGDGEETEDDDTNNNEGESNSVYQPYSEDKESDNIEQEYDQDPRISQRSADINYSQSDSQPVIVDQNLYNKYLALKDHLYDGSEVYPQSVQESIPSYDQKEYDEGTVDVEESYDDYEENLEKLRDPNNNFIDNDEMSAVEQ